MEERLDRELRFHFDCQMADNIRAGMSEDDARRHARLEFGGLQGVKEECRAARGTVWVDSTLQDVRFALRAFRMSPAFTVAAIGTLALGIGANTAIFQLLDAVRLRSLPVPDPQQLARIQIENGNGGFGITDDFADLSYPLLEQLRLHQQAFSDVFGWANVGDERFSEGAQARHVVALLVSGELFPTLGSGPQPAGYSTVMMIDLVARHRRCSQLCVLAEPVRGPDSGDRQQGEDPRSPVRSGRRDTAAVLWARSRRKFDVALPMCTAGECLIRRLSRAGTISG